MAAVSRIASDIQGSGSIARRSQVGGRGEGEVGAPDDSDRDDPVGSGAAAGGVGHGEAGRSLDRLGSDQELAGLVRGVGACDRR